nr:hypothetical protein [Tanacetum cinerariifolium]
MYDDFENFHQNKGKTIYDYYVRFITAVKLNRGLKESNYDQVYAYLKQHEARANENKMMLERFTQHMVHPLALMSNVSPQQVVIQNVQSRQNKGQGNNPRGAGVAGNGGVQNRVGNANLGQARQIKCYNCNGIGHITRNCTQPKQLKNSDYFKDMMLLMRAQENDVVLDEEQLLFLASGHDTGVDEDVFQADEPHFADNTQLHEPPVQDLALNVDNVFQVDECDAFDSDVDEAPTTQTLFMANLLSANPVYDKFGPSYDLDILSKTLFMANLLSANPVYDKFGPSYDLDILSKVQEYDNYQDAVCEHHEAHDMHHDVQPNCVVDSNADYTSDSNMIPYDHVSSILVGILPLSHSSPSYSSPSYLRTAISNYRVSLGRSLWFWLDHRTKSYPKHLMTSESS